MKLVVLGANGQTGKCVLEAALAKGMHVTAVIRSAKKHPGLQHDRLSVKIGDPTNPEFLRGVLVGQDAIVSTLGGRWPTKASTSIYFRSASAIVEAARETDLERVLVTSTGLLFENQTVLGRLLRHMFPKTVSSASRMEQILSQSGLNWTFVRPGCLNNKAESNYRRKRDGMPVLGMSVSRKALARFLVDAIDKSETQCAVFGVACAVA